MCFAGKKKSYPGSVGPMFVHDRLTADCQKQMKAHFQGNLPQGENLLVRKHPFFNIYT